MAKISKVDIADTKIETNDTDTTVNAPVVTILNIRVGNNNADIENILAI